MLKMYRISLNSIITSHSQEMKTKKEKVHIMISNIHIIKKFRLNFTEVGKF